MLSVSKFKDELIKHNIDNNIIDEIYDGYHCLKDKSLRNNKVCFFNYAFTILEKHFNLEELKSLIMSNACFISRYKKSLEFAKETEGFSLQDKISLINQNPKSNMGHSQLMGKTIILHGYNYQVKGNYQCACPFNNNIKNNVNISRDYCCNCGGHFRFHYEIMLGVKLELLEIVSTPLNGNNLPCVFKFKIID